MMKTPIFYEIKVSPLIVILKGGRGLVAESGRTAAAGQTQSRSLKRAVQKIKTENKQRKNILI